MTETASDSGTHLFQGYEIGTRSETRGQKKGTLVLEMRGVGGPRRRFTMKTGPANRFFCRQLRKDLRIREENGVEQGLKTGYRQSDLYMHASRDHPARLTDLLARSRIAREALCCVDAARQTREGSWKAARERPG
jgi:hypothetical protein